MQEFDICTKISSAYVFSDFYTYYFYLNKNQAKKIINKMSLYCPTAGKRAAYTAAKW